MNAGHDLERSAAAWAANGRNPAWLLEGSRLADAIVLVNKQGEPVGTRIFGPVTRELRGRNHMKIVSLAPEVL